MNVPAPIASPAAPLLIGRRSEQHQLVSALRRREPRLVCGPQGSGKSALLQAAIAHLPAADRSHVLTLQPCATPSLFVAELLAQIVRTSDRAAASRLTRSRSISARACAALLIEALSASQYWIVLDPFAPASRPLARVMKHILTRGKTPVYVAARSAHAADLGYASCLYWSSEMRIELGALAPSSARQLVNQETKDVQLAPRELADFRSSVLRAGARLPGPMLEMCRLAKLPSYQSHARLKTALLQIDARIALHFAASPTSAHSQRIRITEAAK
jgi:hypothetical protein